MKVRRVVTGHNVSGKAVFVSDTEIDAPAYGIMPGSLFHGVEKVLGWHLCLDGEVA